MLIREYIPGLIAIYSGWFRSLGDRGVGTLSGLNAFFTIPFTPVLIMVLPELFTEKKNAAITICILCRGQKHIL